MASLQSEGRKHLRAFRLSDVPKHVRYMAADRLVDHEASVAARADLLLAAERPSDRLYYVPVSDEKWRRVMRLNKRGAAA